MQELRYSGALFGIVGNISEIKEGLNFYGDGENPLQWGTACWPKGHKLQPHMHKVRDRLSRHKTQEFLYMISGAMRTDFYLPGRQKVQSVVLKAGDFICLYEGGHGFEMLEDNTKFIEVKNGPYVSVELDKEKFGS